MRKRITSVILSNVWKTRKDGVYVYGEGSSKEERCFQIFSYRSESNKKKVVKTTSFQDNSFKNWELYFVKLFPLYRSSEIRGINCIHIWRQFPFLELFEQLLASMKDGGFRGPDYCLKQP